MLCFYFAYFFLVLAGEKYFMSIPKDAVTHVLYSIPILNVANHTHNMIWFSNEKFSFAMTTFTLLGVKKNVYNFLSFLFVFILFLFCI